MFPSEYTVQRARSSGIRRIPILGATAFCVWTRSAAPVCIVGYECADERSPPAGGCCASNQAWTTIAPSMSVSAAGASIWRRVRVVRKSSGRYAARDTCIARRLRGPLRRLWPQTLSGRIALILFVGVMAWQPLTGTVWFDAQYGRLAEVPVRGGGGAHRRHLPIAG